MKPPTRSKSREFISIYIEREREKKDQVKTEGGGNVRARVLSVKTRFQTIAVVKCKNITDAHKNASLL